MSKIERTRYDGVAMALHWVTAWLIIFMLVFGEELIEAAEHGGDTFLASIHVSTGVAILALTVLRIIWRLTHPAPPLPDSMKPWEVTASKATHLAIYALLIGIPITGWLAFGDFLQEEPVMAAVKIFGVFPLPAGPVLGDIAKEAHEIGSNLMIGLAVLHVLAALKHQFVDDDGVFRRMLPH